MNGFDELTEITKRLRLGSPDSIDANVEVPSDEEYPDVFVSIDEAKPSSTARRVKPVKPLAVRAGATARVRHRVAPYARSSRYRVLEDELDETIDLRMDQFFAEEQVKIHAAPAPAPVPVKPITFTDINLLCQEIEEEDLNQEVMDICNKAGFELAQNGYSYFTQDDILRDMTTYEKYCFCNDREFYETDRISMFAAYGS